MLQTISITVSGKVQGVFYRQGAKEKAQQTGVTGAVRNQPDGTVYIIATGTQQQLDHFVAWCKAGPPRAHVDGVIVQQLPLQEFEKFTIERF